MYARLHFAGTAFDTHKNLETIAYERDLYLMLFGKSFKKVYESKLASNRFNPYTGWNIINNGIIHDKNDSDNLIVDIIHPD